MDKCIFALVSRRVWLRDTIFAYPIYMGSYDQTTLKEVVNKPTDKLAHVEIAREKNEYQLFC